MEKKKKPRYNMWQNSAYMIGLVWGFHKSVIWLCLAEVAAAIAFNLAKLFVTPSLLAAVEAHVPLTELLGIIIGFTGLLILFQAAERYVINNEMYGRVEGRILILRKIIEKANQSAYSNFQTDSFQKTLSKATDTTNYNASSTEAIWQTFTGLLKSVIGFGIYLLLLSNLDIFLIVVVLVTTIIGYFVSKKISGYGYRHREEESKNLRELDYLIRITSEQKGAKDMRIFGIRSWLTEVMDKVMWCAEAFYRKAAGVYIWSNIVDLILAFLRNGAAYAYLIYKVLQGDMSASEFILYFSAVDGFTTWVTGILDNMLTLHQQSLDLDVVREFLEMPEPFLFEDGKALDIKKEAFYEIQLENVSFRYPGAEQDTLSHINLTLHPGEKLAIVGLNGAGKTTLIKLLCGLYDPTEGRVLLNGEDIRLLNRRDYYRMFTAVFQTFFLLAGSVAMNVAQSGDEAEVDMDKVKTCIERAGLTEKIESLPDQYNTLLERRVYPEATMLSGGETQRLMLARALYKDGPIIILDEPTAALDPLAEADIYSKYHEMTKERSSVYISHRLASTRFCDRIILIENGSITEEGTHDELLTKGGHYSKMFAVQSKYYQQEAEDYE